MGADSRGPRGRRPRAVSAVVVCGPSGALKSFAHGVLPLRHLMPLPGCFFDSVSDLVDEKKSGNRAVASRLSHLLRQASITVE